MDPQFLPTPMWLHEGVAQIKDTRLRDSRLQDESPVLAFSEARWSSEDPTISAQAPMRVILYHFSLYYTILYYTILYYTILYYTILYYTILYYTILYYTILSPSLLIYNLLSTIHTVLKNRWNL